MVVVLRGCRRHTGVVEMAVVVVVVVVTLVVVVTGCCRRAKMVVVPVASTVVEVAVVCTVAIDQLKALLVITQVSDRAREMTPDVSESVPKTNKYI